MEHLAAVWLETDTYNFQQFKDRMLAGGNTAYGLHCLCSLVLWGFFVLSSVD